MENMRVATCLVMDPTLDPSLLMQYLVECHGVGFTLLGLRFKILGWCLMFIPEHPKPARHPTAYSGGGRHRAAARLRQAWLGC